VRASTAGFRSLAENLRPGRHGPTTDEVEILARPIPTATCICEVCSASVSELRRGRCWGCYGRWVDSRPVGVGAKCTTCNEKRRRFLKSVELFGLWKPMCFNCAGQLLLLDPMPTTITLLKEAISRERRKRDRRIGKADSRVFRYERRVGERRLDRAEEAPAVDDDMIIEVSYEVVIEHDDFEDLTQIRELVHELRPVGLTG
jgi:hypothetical protein